MPMILAGVAGLALSLVTGGSLGALARVRLRWPVVVVVALAIREAGVLTPLAHSPLAPIVYSASQAALLLWVAWHARRHPGLWPVAAGIAMNLAVVLANGGHMPVDPAAATRGSLPPAGGTGQYILAGPGTILAPLDDRLVLPPPAGRVMTAAYSAGDVVAAAGMATALFWMSRGVGRRAVAESQQKLHGS